VVRVNVRSLVPAALAVLLLAPAAQAQTAPATGTVPALGAASLSVHGGVATKRMRYYAPAQRITVRGFVQPYVAGEVVTLYALRRGRVTKRVRRRVSVGGRYAFRIRAGKPGVVRLVVKHAASAGQVAFKTKSERVQVANWRAGGGDRGLKVLLLQRQLLRLGFATPVTGSFDGLTSNGVLAFRKTNGMGRSGYASRAVFALLLRGEGAYKLRYPKAGKHVEFDWSRQVLVLADKGRAYRTYHTSSGTPATPTVFGTYKFYLQTPGTNAKGMVHSSYFIRGYAIHGYASVPNYPASHGCLRVPIPSARSIFNWIDIGDTIFTYR
jgi:L,D-transpeptidase catalytic domain/Putative peptidoglycan binding domain